MITAINPLLMEGAGMDSPGPRQAMVLTGAVLRDAFPDAPGLVPCGSGVSLDEDVMNQIRRQNSYTAVAKMITTTDDMLRAVLGMTL